MSIGLLSEGKSSINILMEGKCSIEMITDADVKEMNRQLTQMQLNLSSVLTDIKAVLRLKTTDIIREGERLLISMRIPYTDTEAFEPSFYEDEVVTYLFIIVLNVSDAVKQCMLCGLRQIKVLSIIMKNRKQITLTPFLEHNKISCQSDEESK